jgi:hypothetical protein
MKHRLNQTGLPETEKIAQEMDRIWGEGATRDMREMAGAKPKRDAAKGDGAKESRAQPKRAP